MATKVESPTLESEPNVISEPLTRQCVELTGTDPVSIEEKRRTMAFKDMEWLAFSFKNIARIYNLDGLDKLTKLQLDNNMICKIENLSHLFFGLVLVLMNIGFDVCQTNLTWLDLSFNQISKIEGLDALTKLTDLSLFSNNISVIENLDPLTSLQVLSLGNNSLKKLNNLMYLRQFKELRLLKVSGNPICKDPEYKSYALSHISQLTYLDYRRIMPADVTAALEHHQDEMIEIHEKEEHHRAEEQAAAERAEHEAKMREANLNVELMMDDMVREDPEWVRLIQIPGLLDGWNDIKDKFNVLTEEFKNTILEQLERKKSEQDEWQSVVHKFLDERDSTAKAYIMEYEKLKKRTLIGIAQEDSMNVETLLLAPKAKLVQLKQRLLDLEQEVVEVVGELCQQFEGNYSEIIEANKGFYNTYFAQVRDLENSFAAQVTSIALQIIDKYSSETNEVEKLPEDARTLLSDKDVLMTSLQASHDSHTSKIDSLEDKLLNEEVKNANTLLASNTRWERQRNRDRVAEIVNYIERNIMDLEDAVAEEDIAENYG